MKKIMMMHRLTYSLMLLKKPLKMQAPSIIYVFIDLIMCTRLLKF